MKQGILSNFKEVSHGVWLNFNLQDSQFNKGLPYLLGTSRTSPNSSYSMWKTLEKEFCNRSKSELWAWGLADHFGQLGFARPEVGLMLLGSGESKHLHVESRSGPRPWPRKTVFHGVLPICFLVISASSFPPTRQLQLKATSSLRAGTKGTLIYYTSCLARGRVYFGIPALLFAFSHPPSPYRDFIHSTCTPNISQRIFFPFLKRWGQDVEDGHGCFVLEKM